MRNESETRIRIMAFKKGYTPWNKNKKASEEHIQHLIDAHKNNPNYFGNTGPRPKISEAKRQWYKTHDHPLLGKKLSQQTRDKIAAAHLGKKRGPLSEEHRRKVSERQIGKKLSEETKRRIAEAHTGMKMSAEHRRNVSLALQGHEVTEETKKKMSQSQKGRRVSKETRKKQSLARIEWHRLHPNPKPKKVKPVKSKLDKPKPKPKLKPKPKPTKPKRKKTKPTKKKRLHGPNYRRKLSEEWKKHMSESAKRRWQNKKKDES
jgi:hypothetical protein